jgi:hypothetical protein
MPPSITSTDVASSAPTAATDVEIFRRLANPELVDTGTLPLTSFAQAPPAKTGASSSSTAATRALSAAVQEAKEKDRGKPGEKPGERDPPRETRGETKSEKQAEKAERAKKDARASRKRPAAGSPRNNQDGDASSPADEQTSLEKQGYLIELRQLEARGAKLSREFTMDDSLAEIEFELSRQNTALSSANSVSFLRDSMKLLISGIEIANGRLGPFLHLDGWASSVVGDMGRYDHALDRVAKRYFRRQQMSPIMELGLLLIGSLVMHHFKASLFGPAPPPPPAAAPPPPAAAAPTGASDPGGAGWRRELRGPFRR